MENIHEGHRKRMKKRFINSRGSNFNEHELLEILLYYCFPRQDTNPIAHELINKFGSVKALLDAEISELTKVKGVTENVAVMLKLIPEFSKLYLTQKSGSSELSTSKAVKEFFIHFFVGSTREELRIVGLKEDLTIKAKEKLCDGDISSVHFNIRKIIEFCYSNNCDKIIIAHNHLNGSPAPSREDITTTQELRQSLKRVGITLLDHVIVADSMAYSMYDNGCFTIFDNAR